MTIRQLQEELGWALQECKSKEEETAFLNTEVKCHFDFPMHGVAENYKVIVFNKKHGLTLYNGGVERPKGHK